MEWGNSFGRNFVLERTNYYSPAPLTESIKFINIYDIRYLNQEAFKVEGHTVFPLDNPDTRGSEGEE